MDGFSKYLKIKQAGHKDNALMFTDDNDQIFIEEKVDGGNFRFMFKNGNIIFGSRTQQLTSDEGEDTNVQKNFVRCVEYVKEKNSCNIINNLNDIDPNKHNVHKV